MTLSAPEPLKTGTYEIVAPGKIDLGPKDDMALAIYRFDGDNRLTLCFGGADKKRPSEFTADKGDRQIL
jgi:uncharacterized protein (TIGR03067 family)